MIINLKTQSKFLNFHHWIFLISIVIIFTSTSCFQQEETFTPAPTTPESIELTPEPTLTLAFTPQLIPPPYFAWIDPTLPEAVRYIISQQAELNITSSKDIAIMSFSSARSEQIGSWTYLLVAPFYSNLENVKISDILTVWETGVFAIPGYDRLHISEETFAHLSQFWGVPAQEGLSITDDNQILEDIWNDSTALAIIPFEQLELSHKVISVNGQNPLLPSEDEDTYPLSFPIFLSETDPLLYQPFELLNITNFDPSKLTSVALTGVTAMVRNTASIMETSGILYPAEEIGDLLKSADITHINNEVPFAEDCPIPDANQDDLFFCSDDSYIELLESIGTDIVELSGDHFADFGTEAMLHSLDLYDEHNFITYGGGHNLQEGLDPVVIIHNGNKIAFIGCNAKIFEGYATASQTRPGASSCDFEVMIPRINQLAAEDYLVIATMQHEEVDSFFSVSIQRHDFRLLSEAGASIVSGSQAHHPQGFEISGSKFIHYGLGNLFFDQWRLAINDPDIHANKDKAFIDFHYFYDGSYINTRLLPLQFVDNAKPRVMTEEESAPFLFEVYKASKWNNKWIYLFPTEYYNFLKTQ